MVSGRLSKTPRKGVSTPAKTNQPASKSPGSAVKTPAKQAPKTPQSKQFSPKKTPVSTRKRAFLTQNVKEEEIEVIAKKGKQTPKGRKSLPVKAEEDESNENACDDSNDEEIELNFEEKVEADSDEDDDSGDDDEEEVGIKKDDNEDDESSDEATEDMPESPNAKAKTTTKADKPKKSKPKTKKVKELMETPRIVVTNLKQTVTEKALKEHFKDCGEILLCDLARKGKKGLKCLILFKELYQAKCAVSTKNSKPFQGQVISVELCKVLHHFTSENTVTVTNLPTVEPAHVLEYIRKAMTQFGPVRVIKFSSNMVTGKIMFENPDATTAALKAGTVEVMAKKIKIDKFVDITCDSANTGILLYGLTPALTADKIKEALSKQSSVSSVSIGKTKAGKPKTYAQATVLSEENVEKLLAMKTLKVNNVSLDILPLPKSKYFFNRDIGAFFRHPTSIIVENLPGKVLEAQLSKVFSPMGTIERINFVNKHRAAMVVFEHKSSVKKALEAKGLKVNNTVVKVHAVDGVYRVGEKRGFDENTTLYISDIKQMKHIPDLIKKVRETEVNFTRIIPISDCLTKVFKNACFLQFENADLADVVLKKKITIHNYDVKIEKYSPKHEFVTQETNVLVENLDEDVKEVDLWKMFQSFGDINNTCILRSKNKSIGCGYVEFTTVESAQKAIKAGTVAVENNNVLVVQPTREILDKLKRRVPDAFYTKFRDQHKGKGSPGKPPKRGFNKKTKRSPHALKKSTSFKKGAGIKKSPRRSF